MDSIVVKKSKEVNSVSWKLKKKNANFEEAKLVEVGPNLQKFKT